MIARCLFVSMMLALAAAALAATVPDSARMTGLRSYSTIHSIGLEWAFRGHHILLLT